MKSMDLSGNWPKNAEELSTKIQANGGIILFCLFGIFGSAAAIYTWRASRATVIFFSLTLVASLVGFHLASGGNFDPEVTWRSGFYLLSVLIFLFFWLITTWTPPMIDFWLYGVSIMIGMFAMVFQFAEPWLAVLVAISIGVVGTLIVAGAATLTPTLIDYIFYVLAIGGTVTIAAFSLGSPAWLILLIVTKIWLANAIRDQMTPGGGRTAAIAFLWIAVAIPGFFFSG